MQPTRVNSACLRCRQKKLKCNNYRPCQLCSQANIECKEAANKRRRKNTSFLHPSRSPNRMEPSASSIETPTQSRSGSSTFRLVERLFHNHLPLPRNLDAVPDCEAQPASSSSCPVPSYSVENVIGMSLPSATVATILLQSYLHAAHWYLALFYEPAFRSHMHQIIESSRINDKERGFLLLLLIVLVTGARHLDLETARHLPAEFDSQHFQTKAMQAIENHLFLALDDASIDSIAFLFLMSSTYLLMRKAQMGFLVAGMSIRMAQAMSLHSEEFWPSMGDIERQVRRRLWWAIYMTDTYTAQAYGKPPILSNTNFDVSQPTDLDDLAMLCPGFDSLEEREQGEMHRVTLLSYNRYKSQLYMLVAKGSIDMRLEQIQRLSNDLMAWKVALPPELRIENFESDDQVLNDSPVYNIFAMQALTLQATFNNMLLGLLSPLLYREKTFESIRPGIGNQSPMECNTLSSDIHRKLLDTSLSVSRLDQYPKTLRLLASSIATTQVGFQCLTAGVILGMLALRDLSSPQLLEIKYALARIISILDTIGAKTPLCGQSIDVLTEIIHLIAFREAKYVIKSASRHSDRASSNISTPNMATQDSGVSYDMRMEMEGSQSRAEVPTSTEGGSPSGLGLFSDLEMLLGEHEFPQLSQIWQFDPFATGN